MIKKLRIKFIILSIISLLLLFGIIIVSSSMLTYLDLVEKADVVLDMLVENGGRSAHIQPPPREKKENPFGRKPLSPEIMYEARFFTAIISNDGQIASVGMENIAMIDDDEAKDYARQAYFRKSDKGFIDDLRYIKFYKGEKEEECDMCVIFLDCGRTLYTFRNSLFINCLISFAGLFIISIVIIIISKKIVRPLSESYEKQKQFISVAGHEIKTPVTIIDADLEILEMEICEELGKSGDNNEWICDIRRQTKRMAALTNDLLTLSRMDEGRQQFTMIDFPISDIVSETVSSFQSLAHSRGRNIRMEITPMLSYYGDENSMRQLTGILLDNAIKYTKEHADGACEDIILKLEKKSRNICLTVKNSSQPVSDEQLRQFFDRFYRTEQSRSSESGGYGLGLSIAKSIVEAHKGKITATTLDAESVQITVILPVK